jgi:hypothetical protein
MHSSSRLFAYLSGKLPIDQLLVHVETCTVNERVGDVALTKLTAGFLTNGGDSPL